MVNDIMCLKWNKRLWGLTEVVEANKRRKNSSEAINKSKTIRKAHRARVQARQKEILEWDGFYSALETGADKDEKAPPKATSDDQSMEEGDGSIKLSESESDSESS